MKPHHPRKHVGVLVETDDSWGRDVVRAVCRSAQHAGWTLLLRPRDSQNRLRLPRGWEGAGLIVSLRDRTLSRHVRGLSIPVVDVATVLPKEAWFGRIATDDVARARTAYEHFQSRGLMSFACYAPPIGRYSDVRAEAFQRVVQQHGFECAMYEPEKGESSGWLTNYRTASEWLSALPKPLAVFAADPYPARQLVEICAVDSVRIPEEVLILSGDDDELLCNAAMPHISSIQLACQSIGTAAAKMLERMMKGNAPPKRTKLIVPLGVRTRQSTDVLQIDDGHVAAALRFIRDHADAGINVSDILRAVPVSRRRLEQKFQALIKRSPAEEIRRVCFEHVRQRLIETDASIATIARQSGFASGTYLSQAFRATFDEPPSEFRARHRRNL